MTEQIAFAISLTPLLIAIALLRLSRNPRYLISFVYLSCLSGILIFILSDQNQYLSLFLFGLALFALLVRWYRNRREERNRW